MARKKYDERREARRFALILVVIFSVLAGLALWRHHTTRAWVFVGLAGLVGAVATVAFPLWLSAFRLWMKFAEVLSWVMTRVILSVFFYLVLTPVGLLMRLLGKAPMDLRFKDGKASYWIDKPEGEMTVERYEKSF